MRKIPIMFLMFLMFLMICCQGQKKYYSEEKEEIEVKSDKLKSILEYHKELNAEYKDPEKSPLPNKYRKNFEGLDFFAPDTNLVVTAQFVPALHSESFLMPTTTDRTPEYKLFGKAYFTLEGKEFSLEIYQNQELKLEAEYKDYLFLPFLDKTNGDETYAGGRYIDLSIPEGNAIVIDFNKAYNPYCVYSKRYSCPVVPIVNTLSIPIKAGVKKFKK